MGTLNPAIERAILDLGYGKPQLDKRLLDALGATHRGLITLLLRKPLTEDPLAEPKQVGAGTTIEQPPQEPPAAVPLRQSIVPPARPKRTQGKAQLGSNEEELRCVVGPGHHAQAAVPGEAGGLVGERISALGS